MRGIAEDCVGVREANSGRCPLAIARNKGLLTTQIIPLLSEFILYSIPRRFGTNRRRMALIRHLAIGENG